MYEDNSPIKKVDKGKNVCNVEMKGVGLIIMLYLKRFLSIKSLHGHE